MSDKPTLWMRNESRPGERRAPISPSDAAVLVGDGFRFVVEDSASRVFPLWEYEAVGCLPAPADSWPDAPEGTMVIGLGALPEGTEPLRDHLYFAHAYTGDGGADMLLRRFVDGGGTLFDLNSLVDDAGHRVAAFGYWAGYVGAALAVLEHWRALPRPLLSMTRAELDSLLSDRGAEPDLNALVIGARGRSGHGALAALAVAGVDVTSWDLYETRNLDKRALLDHDLLVNAVMVRSPVPPFLTEQDLAVPDRRLSVVCDVSCDVIGERQVIPIYHELTTWESPVREIAIGSHPLRLIAIDHLPTLLPWEASSYFSAQLLKALRTLPDGSVWRRARRAFQKNNPPVLAR